MRYMRTVRELREAHQYTQRELAVAIGVSVGAIAAWEEGNANPTVEQWQQIAHRFVVPVEQLLTAAQATPYPRFQGLLPAAGD